MRAWDMAVTCVVVVVGFGGLDGSCGGSEMLEVQEEIFL
jgi:hypothetical protein